MVLIMRRILSLFMLVAFVHCDNTLNDIIDAKLKQLANDPKADTGSLSGVVRQELHSYYFKLALSGVSKNVTRTSDVTVTTEDDGQVVRWSQQEPELAYTGQVELVWDLGTVEGHDVTGHITPNPVNVELRQKYGRFRVTVTQPKPAGIKSWTLYSRRYFSRDYFHISLTPGLNQALAAQLRNSPFWASVYEGPAWALEWPELSEFLERAQS
ncbi:hypothetical protein HDE_09807 [Halotydeus destructor]|nr:hypothetical protein HDE_09807 [Halotydeus destructor]